MRACASVFAECVGTGTGLRAGVHACPRGRAAAFGRAGSWRKGDASAGGLGLARASAGGTRAARRAAPDVLPAGRASTQVGGRPAPVRGFLCPTGVASRLCYVELE